MTIRFLCPDCNKRLKVDDRYAGRQVNCPRCGQALLIPPAEDSEDEGDEAAELAEDEAPAASASPAAAPRIERDAPPPLHYGRTASLRRGSVAGDDVEPAVAFQRRPPPDEELDLTPMVDVTFQLLIFFMLTAAFALQKSIDLPTPDPSQAAAQSRTLEEIEEDEDYVIVRIEDDNVILLEDKEVSRHEIVPRLREMRERPLGKSNRPPNSLMVLASGNALHETVVLVLDAGTEVGMENVRLSTQDDDG